MWKCVGGGGRAKVVPILLAVLSWCLALPCKFTDACDPFESFGQNFVEFVLNTFVF
jgi:hypothetical protein